MTRAGIHSTVYDLDMSKNGYIRLRDMRFLSRERVIEAGNWLGHKRGNMVPFDTEYIIENIERIEWRMIPFWKRVVMIWYGKRR